MIIPELKKQIDLAPIEQFEREELIMALGKTGDDFQKELAETAADRPELLPYLYINFAAKKYAISKNDPSAFRSAVENAKEYLEAIDNDEK